eukprot:CAMPEP_0117422780 /NCGR_PEP_ID=MMETSP0758-20121206/3561_1 /TAXON_ID=63605 /ORGANISM="Percolomonas cosmopolitus, Strain AE-1 (ATCC 50343)" /LENGTH=501 /DNA_ID=CAMNT_0005205625 /DNA_START=220 /DNA_END=1721 /DNA_ORIENTATION=-
MSTYTGVNGITEIQLDNEVEDEDDDLQLDELDDMRWKRMSQQCETLKHRAALLEGTITLLEKEKTSLKKELEEEKAKKEIVAPSNKNPKKDIQERDALIASLKAKNETLQQSYEQLVNQLVTTKKAMKKQQEKTEGVEKNNEEHSKQMEQLKTEKKQIADQLTLSEEAKQKAEHFGVMIKNEMMHRQLLDQYILFNLAKLGTAMHGISEMVHGIKEQGTSSIFAKNTIVALNYKIASSTSFAHAGYWCQWITMLVTTLMKEEILQKSELEKRLQGKQNAHKIAMMAKKELECPSFVSIINTDADIVLTHEAFLMSITGKLILAYQHMLQPMLNALDRRLIKAFFLNKKALGESIVENQGKQLIDAFEEALADHFAQVKATFSEALSMHVFHDLLAYLDSRLFNHLLKTCVEKGSVSSNYMINLKMGMSVIENYYELSLKLPLTLVMTRDVFNVMLTSIPQHLMNHKESICPHLTDEHIHCFLASNNEKSDNLEETPSHISG